MSKRQSKKPSVRDNAARIVVDDPTVREPKNQAERVSQQAGFWRLSAVLGAAYDAVEKEHGGVRRIVFTFPEKVIH